MLVDDLRDVMPGRLLDLGAGDGRLASLVLDAYPGTTVVCVDLSETMLAAAAKRFGERSGVQLVPHDLDELLPTTAPFDQPFGVPNTKLAVGSSNTTALGSGSDADPLFASNQYLPGVKRNVLPTHDGREPPNQVLSVLTAALL